MVSHNTIVCNEYHKKTISVSSETISKQIVLPRI